MNKQIATTILQQLGGNKFLAMTGAKNLLIIERGLSFKLPSNFAKNKINVVRITVNESDLYDITFCYQRGLNLKDVSSISGVYAEDLQEVFTSETGLDTSL